MTMLYSRDPARPVRSPYFYLESVESQIIRMTIDALLHEGYEIAVNDGEEVCLFHTRNASAVLAAMRTTDEDYLVVNKPGEQSHMKWVRFIYGNDDTEVINDYTVSLESVMYPIFKMIDKLENPGG